MPTNALTANFKLNLLTGGHNFAVGGLAYKMLLVKVGFSGVYDQTLANVGTPGSGSPSVTNVGTDEVTGTGYTSGGVAMGTNTAPALSSNVATTTWATNPSWTSASFSAVGAVIDTADATLGVAGRTVGTFDFGGTQTVAAGTFTVVLPSNTSTLAIIRIS
jgi:hypothetical protein